MRKIHVGEFILGEEEKKAINNVLSSGRISEHDRVREFEEKWAEFIGTKYSVLLNSGTSALIAGLTALQYNKDIKASAKVITSPLTYIATSNAVMLSGLEPVYVDVDRNNFLITPESIKIYLEGINDAENYSLILPVHLCGYSCDMNGINKLAKKYSLKVFEDSSQAHGTIYDGKKAGSLSMLSTFSFYIAHNIQAGELGALNTNDVGLLKMVRKIKANGRLCDCLVCTRHKGLCPKILNYKGKEDFDPRFVHDVVGYNFKTTEFNASLAITQLKNIDKIIRKRQENVKFLNEGLENFSDILQLPLYSNKVSYMVYPIVIKKPGIISRKKIRLELEKNNIETRPLFGSIPTQQPAYHFLKERYNGKIPNADYLGLNAFYIGCHQYLKQDDLDYILNKFKEILKRAV